MKLTLYNYMTNCQHVCSEKEGDVCCTSYVCIPAELAPSLSHIFRLSLEIGKIPEEWTVANICPLYKKNDRSLPVNCRPVSLTCIVCKLLEHIVCSQVMGHLDSNKIITTDLRKHHSCETQLTHVVHDWTRSLENG